MPSLLQLGLGRRSYNIPYYSNPQIFPSIDYSDPISEVAAGYAHTLFLTSTFFYSLSLNFPIFYTNTQEGGALYSCGLTQGGRCGVEAREKTLIEPTKVQLGHSKIVFIAAGAAHSLVASKRTIFLFGDNTYGQCGCNPQETNSLQSPRQLPFLHDQNISQVSCGSHHSFVLTEGCN